MASYRLIRPRIVSTEGKRESKKRHQMTARFMIRSMSRSFALYFVHASLSSYVVYQSLFYSSQPRSFPPFFWQLAFRAALPIILSLRAPFFYLYRYC